MSDSRAGMQQTLLVWAEEHLRDLPWRRTRDPWSILVAEVMLQQTQVGRVTERWVGFLERFPDATVCADASPATLLREWAGLGYNRRALMLHQAATAIRDGHEGVVPADLDALLLLPGVGPYTARAVLAFAFEAEVAPVDTNIGRVLARLEGRSLGNAAAQDLADSLVPDGAGWRWNQGIMELGALVCTKRSPSCGDCPLAAGCGWRGRGPDPAVGSAGVGRAQAPFAGSNRELRGRAIARLREGSAERAALASWLVPDDPAKGREVLAGLIADGLVDADGRAEEADGRVRLVGDDQPGPVSADNKSLMA